MKIKRTRKFRDYTVMEVRDPGVNSRHVYYEKGNIRLIVSELVDANLDGLIRSFEPVGNAKEGVSP